MYRVIAVTISVKIIPSKARRAISMCWRCETRVVMVAKVAIGMRRVFEVSIALGNYRFNLWFTRPMLLFKLLRLKMQRKLINNSQSYHFI